MKFSFSLHSERPTSWRRRGEEEKGDVEHRHENVKDWIYWRRQDGSGFGQRFHTVW